MREVWLVAFLVLGCGGVDLPRVPTPGTCGFWEKIRTIEAEPGECVWTFSDSHDVVLRPPGDCPSEGDPTCSTAIPGEPLEAWGELSRPENAVLEVRFDLLDDGTCPVSCSLEFGCRPSENVPAICVPCTEAEPCP